MMHSDKSPLQVDLYHDNDNLNSDYLNKVYKGVHDVCRKLAYFAVMDPLVKPYGKALRVNSQAYQIDGLGLTISIWGKSSDQA